MARPATTTTDGARSSCTKSSIANPAPARNGLGSGTAAPRRWPQCIPRAGPRPRRRRGHGADTDRTRRRRFARRLPLRSTRPWGLGETRPTVLATCWNNGCKRSNGSWPAATGVFAGCRGCSRSSPRRCRQSVSKGVRFVAECVEASCLAHRVTTLLPGDPEFVWKIPSWMRTTIGSAGLRRRIPRALEA